MRSTAVVVILAVTSFGLPTTWAGTTGRVCLAAAPTLTAGQRSLANATGGLPDVTYSIQINAGQPIELSRDVGRWVEGLDLRQRHLVIVRADGRQIASFHFRFSEDGAPDLCLFMNSLYETWQLWPDKRCPWCRCNKAP